MTFEQITQHEPSSPMKQKVKEAGLRGV